MRIALIGTGAIASYVRRSLNGAGHSLEAVLVRPARVAEAPGLYVGSVEELPEGLDVVVDCAGHAALAEHGPSILARGTDLVTVSLGALADASVLGALKQGSHVGGGRLHLASGAIGALDSLQAARVGGLDAVTYSGRKPPGGWRGSPAEETLDLDRVVGAAVHFEGTAREAALAYPKNANVAAAVALAGAGFDATQVRLIADAGISDNIHEIEATGAFGTLHFRIDGTALSDNPRSSALAAMSVVAKLEQMSGWVSI